MKPTALFLIVSLLYEFLAPGVTVFAEELTGGKPGRIGKTRSTTLSARKPLSDRERALAVAEQRYASRGVVPVLGVCQGANFER